MKPDQELTLIYQNLIRLNNKIIKKCKEVQKPAIIYSPTSPL